jgi:hypothetical protein
MLSLNMSGIPVYFNKKLLFNFNILKLTFFLNMNEILVYLYQQEITILYYIKYIIFYIFFSILEIKNFNININIK